jgi:hypothetical protein
MVGFPIYPPILFVENAFGLKAISLQPLQYKKGHQGSNPGGHSFVFLNVSINKKPIFFSEVVNYKKDK